MSSFIVLTGRLARVVHLCESRSKDQIDAGDADQPCMARSTMAKLTEAKIREVAMAYKPRGWDVCERKRRHQADGYALLTNKTIYCLPLKDSYALFVFLHEVAHVCHGHMSITPRDDPPEWQLEMEAEQFAIKAFKDNGIPVDKWSMETARENVAFQFHTFPESVEHDNPACTKALKFAFPKTWREWL